MDCFRQILRRERESVAEDAPGYQSPNAPYNGSSYGGAVWLAKQRFDWFDDTEQVALYIATSGDHQPYSSRKQHRTAVCFDRRWTLRWKRT